MDLTDLARRLGLDGSKHIVRQAAELRRMCDVKFDSSVIGVGEVCKAVICLEIAATRGQEIFNKDQVGGPVDARAFYMHRKKGGEDDNHIFQTLDEANETRQVQQSKQSCQRKKKGSRSSGRSCPKQKDTNFAIKLSGMSEKAYIWSFNALHHGLGVVSSEMQLDIRKLGIQFGCVRLIPIVKRGLLQYKNRFMASLPASRKECADFTRPVFTAVAFYLCAKKQKLKVDKMKLIELCGTSEAEFSSVSNSMQELCFEIFGSAKEKKDPREIKGNRDLLDALPGKRKIEDGGYFSDEDNEHSSYQKRKIADMGDYDEWKSTVLATNKQTEAKAHCKPAKQLQLNFGKDVVKT